MKTLIIAPHIDDETIGCWSLLLDDNRKVTVCWGYELTEQRKDEANKLACYAIDCKFGFEHLTPEFIKTFDEVYVPSRRDWHADHKATCAAYRQYATHFYSVDMANGRYLGEEESSKKRKFLDAWFPSQSGLWANEAKYWLFEDIQRVDYDVLEAFKVTVFGMTATVEVPRAYTYEAQKAARWAPPAAQPSEVFSYILSAVPSGKVRMTVNNHIYEA
jgi:LmbE family N-acetylglucosaminyl deacetylase